MIDENQFPLLAATQAARIDATHKRQLFQIELSRLLHAVLRSEPHDFDLCLYDQMAAAERRATRFERRLTIARQFGGR